MDDVKNLLTVTLVVMAAGSSIYTIKTYMKPGMDLNINLEESAHIDEMSGNSSDFATILPESLISFTTDFPFDIENNTIAFELISVENKTDRTNSTNNLDRKRSLPSTAKPQSIINHQIAKSDMKAIVSTSLGKIEGIQMNVLGKTIFAYLGVNYAQAPIDKLRFKKAVPVTAWNNGKTLSAKQFGKACLQVNPQNQTTTTITTSSQTAVEFGENCLNVNIWTPCNGQNNPLPVLFFIHGGSFSQGNNAADETDGRVLASLQNIVVVNANFRLGPFGFLNLPGQDSANLGLHDLVEALKFTRNNIKYFGGNPDLITVVGQGSGALASALLLTSPETKHLFKRAILQSGASTVFDFYYKQKSSEEFASMLGCLRSTERITSSNQESVWKCVQNATSDELQRTAEKQLSRELYSYTPKIGDSLVPSSPKIMLDELKHETSKKEILVGTNANEASFFAHMGYPQLFTKRQPSLKDLEEVRQFLSASLKDWGISRRTLRLINSFFLEKSSTIEPKAVLRSMYDIFGDLTFTCPTLYFAEKFATKQNHSSYFYYFNHNQANHQNRSTASNDELPYVFGHPLRFPHKYSGVDIDLSKKMMNIWATFIRTGKPPAIGGSNWPRFSAENQSYVELNGKELRVIHQAAGGTNATNSSSTQQQRFNCDTWKHAFKIFT